MERRSGEDHRRLASQERRGLLCERAQHVGLQRDDDAVLRPELRRALARPDAPEDGLVAVEQFQSIPLHSLEMRAAATTARRSRGCELRGDVAADRPGAEYADLHRVGARSSSSLERTA